MSDTGRSTFGVPLPRLEDRRHLSGQGRFVADIAVPGMAHAIIVRAPVAHATIKRIDVREARDMPGVLLVLTGADILTAELGALPCLTPVESTDGTPFRGRERPLLCLDAVRFVGDAVAMVVAETVAAALDAVERIDIDYDERPALTDLAASDDIAFTWHTGDGEATGAAFAAAEHTVTMQVVNNRVAIAPIEPRAAIGLCDRNDHFTLLTQSQGVHFLASILAKQVLKVPVERLRVITPDVGGSFGMKLMAFPEQGLVLHAARLLGRPVKWVGDRTDAFLTDLYGRDHLSQAELALDADDRITGLRIRTRGNLGAYASTLAPSIMARGFSRVVAHVYDIPAVHLTVEGVYTNTTPVDAYRGAGKPEAVTLVERLVERAARQRGLDPVDFRRRNLVPAAKMPYRTALGLSYDTGDFAAVLERALSLADWDGYPVRRRQSEAAGKRRGIGLGLYLHTTGGDTTEISEVALMPNRTVRVRTGTQASGQGHETTFAQIVADRLGLAPDSITVEQGDTDQLVNGGGTGGSSSLPIGATTVLRATELMLKEARALAADRLEAAPADLEFANGDFTIVGTDRSVHLFDLGSCDRGPKERICGGNAIFEGENTTFPNGAYVCEVELDPETGVVRVIAFSGVDDLGVVLNPNIAEGQIQGGIAQSIGQALLERVAYDPETGQLQTGSFMDYALPHADDLPMFKLDRVNLPTTNNSLGMKGAGEVGTIGAAAPVINAVADALGHDRIDMPATPEAVWRALRSGGA